MKSTFLFLVAAALLAIFAGVNWQAFSQPTELNLLVTSVVAPLGIVLLVVIGVLLLAMATVLAWARTASLLQHRAHARESDRLRTLSENAEASRLAELRGWLEAEMKVQAERSERLTERMLARIDAVETGLLRRQEEGENSLAAQLGELEDRLDGHGRPAAGRLS